MHIRGLPPLSIAPAFPSIAPAFPSIAPAFRREIHLLVILLSALSLAAGCKRASSISGIGAIELGVPGLANAHVTLAADGDRVAAAWAASGAKGTDVYSAVSADGGRTFGRPVRVNDVDGDARVNGEQPPRVLMKGTAVDVIWVSKRAGVATIRAAASTDGGATFTPARSITPPGVTGARGWESATLGPDGRVHAVWLDGRFATPSPSRETGFGDTSGAWDHSRHAPLRPRARKGASRRRKPSSTSTRRCGGPLSRDVDWRGGAVETSVAANVCFAGTAVVARGGDVFVAWRHPLSGGVRDIAVARSRPTAGAPSDPVA